MVAYPIVLSLKRQRQRIAASLKSQPGLGSEFKKEKRKREEREKEEEGEGGGKCTQEVSQGKDRDPGGGFEVCPFRNAAPCSGASDP